MLKIRLIAVVIVRDGQVVQSVQFRHTNVIHYDAFHAIESFNRWAVDEIVFLNVSKSIDSQRQFLEIVAKVSETCFVPLAVGGWVTNEEYAAQLIAQGADKLVLNSAFKTNPKLVTALSDRFGRQCIVASIDFRKDTPIGPSVSIDRGTQDIGVHPHDWARTVVAAGAGEIMLNCIEHDGNRKGYALAELEQVCQAVSVPVIAFGGVFRWQHLVQGVEAGASAVAAANIFHYTEHSTKHAKKHMADAGIPVRKEGVL